MPFFEFLGFKSAPQTERSNVTEPSTPTLPLEDATQPLVGTFEEREAQRLEERRGTPISFEELLALFNDMHEKAKLARHSEKNSETVPSMISTERFTEAMRRPFTPDFLQKATEYKDQAYADHFAHPLDEEKAFYAEQVMQWYDLILERSR